MTPRITLIAALARNRVIGRGNRMPWHLSDDLKRFKALTLGHPIVMGRKTYESVAASAGGPLPGRVNIVVTRSPDFSAPGCRIVHSIEDALRAVPDAAEVFVIGGGEIYSLALPFAGRLEFTEIDAEFAGDAYFPEFDRSAWREVRRESRRFEGPGGFRFDFATYDRPDE